MPQKYTSLLFLSWTQYIIAKFLECMRIYIYIYIYIYTHTHRVIRKSLRDFRPLRYSSRDGHAEGEHVNRKRATPSFCPTLQVLDILTSDDS